jgi:hypothetical protein
MACAAVGRGAIVGEVDEDRPWEGWLIVSFLADTVAALFAVVAASVSSLRPRQYVY